MKYFLLISFILLLAIYQYGVSKHLKKQESKLLDKKYDVIIDNDKKSETYNQKFVRGLFVIKFNKRLELSSFEQLDFGIDNILNPRIKKNF